MLIRASVQRNLGSHHAHKKPIKNGVIDNIPSGIHILNWHHSKGTNEFLPTLDYLLNVYFSAPVSSASAERSFSSLRQILTYLRQTIGQDRLCNLAMIYLNRDISNQVINKNMDNLIYTFAQSSKKKSQRADLLRDEDSVAIT